LDSSSYDYYFVRVCLVFKMRCLMLNLDRAEILWLNVKCMDCGNNYEIHGWELLKIHKLECPYCKANKQLSEKG